MRPHDEAPRADRRTSFRHRRDARRAGGAWLSLALSLALLPLLGCNPDAGADEMDEPGEFDSPAAETRTAPPAAPRPQILNESSFEAAEGTDVEIDGTLEVVDRNGTLELAVHVEGLPPGEHAWHIHSAPCGDAAPVVLALSSTSDMEGTVGPVTIDPQGMVDRTVRLPGLDRSWVGSGTHSLHIHQRPGTDHGPTLACANI